MVVAVLNTFSRNIDESTNVPFNGKLRYRKLILFSFLWHRLSEAEHQIKQHIIEFTGLVHSVFEQSNILIFYCAQF